MSYIGTRRLEKQRNVFWDTFVCAKKKEYNTNIHLLLYAKLQTYYRNIAL
jgi:hypothetical protein